MPMRLLSCLAPAIAALRDRIRRWTRPSTRVDVGRVGRWRGSGFNDADVSIALPHALLSLPHA